MEEFFERLATKAEDFFEWLSIKLVGPGVVEYWDEWCTRIKYTIIISAVTAVVPQVIVWLILYLRLH